MAVGSPYCLHVVFVLASPSDTRHVHLQRGINGEITCPVIADGTFAVSAIESAYWYKDDPERNWPVVSKFQGKIYHVSNSTSGKYNISEELSLVIRDVADSDEARYFCKLKPNEYPVQSRFVDATVFVSPSERSPKVEECDMTGNPGVCLVQLYPEEMEYHLTCHVTNARPAVDLHWVRVLGDGSTESVHNVTHRVIRGTDKLYNGTQGRSLFTSFATVTGIFHDDITLVCKASGVALGGSNGSYVEVHITYRMQLDMTTKSFMTEEDATLSTSDSATASGTALGEYFSGLILMAVLGFGFFFLATVVIVVLVIIKKPCKRDPENVEDAEQVRIEMTDLIDGKDSVKTAGIMRMCADQLKTYYGKEMSTIPIHPILLSSTRKIKDIFISLQLFKETHKTVKADKPVRLKGSSQEFFTDNPVKVPLESQDDLIGLLINNSHVIVVGTAGRGKTTLTRKIAYDWTCKTEESVLSHFKLVFVLRMKEIKDSSGILDAIQGILPTDTKLSRQHLRGLIIKANQKVLIILDGLDEISSHVLDRPAPNDDDFSIKDVLSFKALRNCSVLVTTRPHKMHVLQEYYSNYTVVENTGFSSENRNKYIAQYFSDDVSKGRKLIQEVHSTAFIHTLAQSPIMLLLLCLIWNHDQTLPQRVTELYNRAVNVLVSHFSGKHNHIQHNHKKMDALKEEIGRVAFEGLVDPLGERLVFSPDDFPDTLEYGLQIGVLYQETKTIVEQVARMVNFLHKSFQEYFAAYFLATKARDKIREKLLPQVTVDTVQEKEYLLRFCCGMNVDAAAMILDHVRGLSEELQTPIYLWIQSFSLVLVFEAQSSDLVAAVQSRLTLKFKEDFPAMEYYLQSFNPVHLDRLNIHLTLITDQSLTRKILEHVTVDSLYFHVALSGQLQDQLAALSETISKMPHRPQVTRLYVAMNDEQSSNPDEFDSVVSSQIKQLCHFIREQSGVSGFGIGLEGNILRSCQEFEDFIQALVACKAVYLCIDDNNLHCFLGHLSPLIQYLTSLVLRRCNLMDDDLTEVSKSLVNARQLTCLYFEGSSFCLSSVYSLVDTVKSMHLDKLYLPDIGLDSTVLSQIVRTNFPSMKEFKSGFFTK